MATKKRKTKSPLKKTTTTKKVISPLMTEKQKIKDLEHMINMDLGTFLVLIDEGNMEQVTLSKQKAKSSLLKYGPDMYRLAQNLDETMSELVKDFLVSVDEIVHSSGVLDPALIKMYYNATQVLDKTLR